MSKEKSISNPDVVDRAIFYPVAAVGGLFCVTILICIAAALGDPLAPVNQWINQRVTGILLGETLLLVTVGVGAMTADRVRTIRQQATRKRLESNRPADEREFRSTLVEALPAEPEDVG